MTIPVLRIHGKSIQEVTTTTSRWTSYPGTFLSASFPVVSISSAFGAVWAQVANFQLVIVFDKIVQWHPVLKKWPRIGNFNYQKCLLESNHITATTECKILEYWFLGTYQNSPSSAKFKCISRFSLSESALHWEDLKETTSVLSDFNTKEFLI